MDKITYYVVNIENCTGLDEAFDGLKEFLVMDGQYGHDFDLVEDELDPNVCNKLRYECEAVVTKALGIDDEMAEAADFMPLGFDLKSIPHGATIKRIGRATGES